MSPPDLPSRDAINELRVRTLLSLQRALLGEVTPEMQAVAVQLDPARLRVTLYLDAAAPESVPDDFDGGAMSQVVADFCWPEKGDPRVEFECVRLSPGEPIALPAGSLLVFARARVEFAPA